MRARSLALHALPLLALLRLLMLIGGCDRHPHGAATTAPATEPSPQAATAPAAQHPTVASLVPAATDLLVGMGAADHLVGISNYDIDQPGLHGLPRVGDYQTIDWERIRASRPDVMIIFQAPDRVPAGLKERADELHITLVNVQTDTLADLFREADHLGQIVHEREKADRMVSEIQSRLDRIRQRVAGQPPVRTLLACGETGTDVVGTGNFLNDLLEIAGGENVVTTPGWPSLDRERILDLHPDAVVHLLSGVSPQVEARARAIWATMPSLPAVRAGRVSLINVYYAQQPGPHVAELAEKIADALHPPAAASTR